MVKEVALEFDFELITCVALYVPLKAGTVSTHTTSLVEYNLAQPEWICLRLSLAPLNLIRDMSSIISNFASTTFAQFPSEAALLKRPNVKTQNPSLTGFVRWVWVPGCHMSHLLLLLGQYSSHYGDPNSAPRVLTKLMSNSTSIQNSWMWSFY